MRWPTFHFGIIIRWIFSTWQCVYKAGKQGKKIRHGVLVYALTDSRLVCSLFRLYKTKVDTVQHKINPFTANDLTPSPPQPVKCPCRKIHGRACKEYIFRSYNSYFQCFAFSWLSFHMPVQKKKKRLKGLKFRTIIGRFQVTSWQWRGCTSES